MDPSPALSELLRPALFFAVLVLLSMAEQWRPVRLSDPQRLLRWPANLALLAMGLVIVMALQASLLGTALWAQDARFGLFNHVEAPRWLEALLAWLMLDLATYALHRCLHELRWLWPLHRVHHSDVEFDVTTGLRFHPAEVLLTQTFKIAVIALLGAPWAAVVAMEIGLSLFVLLAHANLRLAPGLERGLRLLLVTPDMHRTHHSVHADERNANYGNVLSLWDRLLRTHVAASREPHRSMRIGLTDFRVPEDQTLRSLLVQPLHS